MKKIAFITTDISGCGGTERVNVNLANALSDSFSVDIITFRQENEGAFFSLNPSINIMNLGVELHTFKKFKLLGAALSFFKRMVELRKVLSANNYSIVISMGYYINWLSAALANRNRWSTYLCEHRDYSNINIKYRILLNLFYNRANATVVLSQSQKDKFPNTIKNINVIPNFGQFKTETNLLNHKNIVYISRIDEEKRVHLLLEAFINNLGHLDGYSLIIAGDGPKKMELEEKYKNYKNISFPGFITNVEEILTLADLAVLPSQCEAFPMTILEGMSKGVPFIGFDVPGVRDLIIHNKTGLLVTSPTANALGEAMVALIKDKDRLRSYSDNSLKEITKFSKEAVMKMWFEIF